MAMTWIGLGLNLFAFVANVAFAVSNAQKGKSAVVPSVLAAITLCAVIIMAAHTN